MNFTDKHFSINIFSFFTLLMLAVILLNACKSEQDTTSYSGDQNDSKIPTKTVRSAPTNNDYSANTNKENNGIKEYLYYVQITDRTQSDFTKKVRNYIKEAMNNKVAYVDSKYQLELVKNADDLQVLDLGKSHPCLVKFIVGNKPDDAGNVEVIEILLSGAATSPSYNTSVSAKIKSGDIHWDKKIDERRINICEHINGKCRDKEAISAQNLVRLAALSVFK